MTNEHLFKWKHYQPDIILLTMRWYLRYNLSFRDLVEMMEERGLSMAHTTIMRWVHQYGPELDKRIRRHLCYFAHPRTDLEFQQPSFSSVCIR
ncbi:UNVERIFIED_ORG: transposase-like protein [Peribacillus simplex]